MISGLRCLSISFVVASIVTSTALAGLDIAEVPGMIVDDNDARLDGDWKKSTSVAGYFGDGYRHAPAGSGARATFATQLTAGTYHVLMSYTHSSNRPSKVAVEIRSADGVETVYVNQKKPPVGAGSMHSLGQFRFEAGDATVVISTDADNGAVIIDTVAWLTADQLAALKAKPPTAKQASKGKSASVAEKAPDFVKAKPSRPLHGLTSEELDQLLEKHVAGIKDSPSIGDDHFLRRVTLDLVGRHPTVEEQKSFSSDRSPDKRSAAIDRLLASPQFGRNWGNYWSDVISNRIPQPQLTFLNYTPLKQWLAESFNHDKCWDEIVYEIITATGFVGDNPAATFVGFHQADKTRLAGETTRIFLGTQIQCAECHDHKFIDMPQETFHHFAAFFVRTAAKLPHNNSNAIEVNSKSSGEHRMPGEKSDIQPVAFNMKKVDLGLSDLQRRTELAEWIVTPDNPWFAKAFANHIWARLMGTGFSDPVDEIGELGSPVLPEIHNAVGEHFAATGFDIKALMRLIANTDAYARGLPKESTSSDPLAKAVALKMRGDEVYDCLATAIDLPNVTPPQAKATGAVRFPPPPKSTRELVNEAYGFDPTMPSATIVRSMKQAMFMMNNDQVQSKIVAESEAKTMLADLLREEKDDATAIKRLFERVLARPPSERELEIAKAHLTTVGQRDAAFEDLLWSLLNSAEFTTRR